MEIWALVGWKSHNQVTLLVRNQKEVNVGPLNDFASQTNLRCIPMRTKPIYDFNKQ